MIVKEVEIDLTKVDATEGEKIYWNENFAGRN